VDSDAVEVAVCKTCREPDKSPAHREADHNQQQGPTITLEFEEINGIKPDETPVRYRGVEIGRVTDIDLADDRSAARVHIRLDADRAQAHQNVARVNAAHRIARRCVVRRVRLGRKQGRACHHHCPEDFLHFYLSHVKYGDSPGRARTRH